VNPLLIGGEESGSKRDWAYSRKDGVLADMLVAETITKKPLSQLVAEAIAEADGPLTTTP